MEICVVDGGSRDDTVERARQCAGSLEPTVSFSVIEFGALGRPAGRAAQLQAGVEATIGDAVVLLHADTRLPLGWSRLVRTALSRAGVCGGAFRFAFDEVGDRSRAPTSNERAALRFVERGARLRVALFGLPYGDQALFVRRSALEAIGGIPQVGWMEDLDLVRALKQHGRLAMLDAPAPTSPRRHLDRGVWRTALRHTAAAGAWAAGVDRRRIARWVKR